MVEGFLGFAHVESSSSHGAQSDWTENGGNKLAKQPTLFLGHIFRAPKALRFLSSIQAVGM